jgi:hypothetical protein
MKMEGEPSFIKGFVITLALYLLALPIGIIPLVGPILAITLVPYLASALGTRWADPKERLPLAITCSLIWSGVMTLVLILVMRAVGSVSPGGFKIGALAWIVIIVLWAFNILFTVLGALYPWRDPFQKPEV